MSSNLDWEAVNPMNFGYEDLLRKGINAGFSTLSLLKDYEPIGRFAKLDSDAPLTSAYGTAAWNAVYGRDVWVWTNMQANAFAALAKQPWIRSGIRIKTANSSSLVSGLGETSAVPLSTLPTYDYMKYPLKQLATRLDYTAKMVKLSASGDDAIPTPDQLVKDKTEEHILGLNQAILGDALAIRVAGASADNAGTNLFEHLDRVISADAEEDDLGGSYHHWYDPYVGFSVVDRDGNAIVHDSVVVHGNGTNCYQTGDPDFAVAATLTLDAKDVLLQQCLANGLRKENGFWLTGWDTYFRLKQLYEVKERFMNPAKVTFSVNGVSTPSGAEVGFGVSTMDDMPIIIDQNAPKNSNESICRLFLIDKSNVFMRIATPTTRIDLGFPAFSMVNDVVAQRLGYGAILLTEGELVCTRFNTSGKLCALK